MKRMRYIFLAAIATAAFMATIGAGTAAATPTSLCQVEETVEGLPVCKEANQYPAGTPVHAALEEKTKLVLETPLGKVECAQSTLLATTEQRTEFPLGALVNALTFGGCGEYEVVTVVPGTLDIEVIDQPVWTHNGTLTFTNTQIKVKKGKKECVYRAGHSGVLTGGAMATIDLEGTLTRLGGVECPVGNATWKGSYTVLNPEPLWVAL